MKTIDRWLELHRYRRGRRRRARAAFKRHLRGPF